MNFSRTSAVPQRSHGDARNWSTALWSIWSAMRGFSSAVPAAVMTKPSICGPANSAPNSALIWATIAERGA